LHRNLMMEGLVKTKEFTRAAPMALGLSSYTPSSRRARISCRRRHLRRRNLTEIFMSRLLAIACVAALLSACSGMSTSRSSASGSSTATMGAPSAQTGIHPAGGPN
jgi:hypothetical protein